MLAQDRISTRQIARLFLTAEDVSKYPSVCWTRRCLVQWIEATFGHDEETLDDAYSAITGRISEWLNVELNDVEGISDWAERPDVTEADIAKLWNEAIMILFNF